jgi:signal peptidase II
LSSEGSCEGQRALTQRCSGAEGFARPAQMAWRLAIVVGLVAIDLWSKHAVFGWLASGPPGVVLDAHAHARYPLVGEWLAFTRSWNPGAAFGQLGQFPRALVFGRCIAVVVLVWMLLRTPGSQTLLVSALVLILAGAAGNLCDNLFLERRTGHSFGMVRDFIDVYFPRWDWHFPTFNAADSCITVGACLLLLSCLFSPRSPERTASCP